MTAQNEIKELKERLKRKDETIQLLKDALDLAEKNNKLVEDMFELATGVPLNREGEVNIERKLNIVR